MNQITQYTIPIAARFIHSRDTFEPGPFYLGKWVSDSAIEFREK